MLIEAKELTKAYGGGENKIGSLFDAAYGIINRM